MGTQTGGLGKTKLVRGRPNSRRLPVGKGGSNRESKRLCGGEDKLESKGNSLPRGGGEKKLEKRLDSKGPSRRPPEKGREFNR